MAKTFKVIVAPHTRPFYGTKIREPGEVLNLFPDDVAKHSSTGEPLKDKSGKPLVHKKTIGGHQKDDPILSCGLASWMIEFSDKALQEVQDEINPPEKLDPVTDPVTH